ncbi:MAG: RNA-binding transcriptional accessory protein [Deltaproteobacteria bacterium]|nr:RNA-binding transcriptional accessory protein [Deltaproteobacteria bacterium]
MSETAAFDPVPGLARELGLGAGPVRTVVQLLGEGNTVPFIARYRKERTSGLDETQIRAIEERHAFLLEFEKRRQKILTTINEQGKLTPELEASILACTTRAELEDLYLPYRPKRRTRATMARERGLEPLAQRILEQPREGDPAAEARAFVNPEKDVHDVEAALAGARDIVAETVAEDAGVRRRVRDVYARQGKIVSHVARGVEGPTKFQDWYDYSEPASTIPSHRYLAVARGESEEVLKIGVEVEMEPLVSHILARFGHAPASPFAAQLREAVEDGFRRLVHPSAENELRSGLKTRSDGAAVEVFARNLESLLLAAPFGTRPVVGVDPGLRTGCKCAAVDRTGTFLENMTFNLVAGDAAKERGRADLGAFLARHRPAAVACGNGTGGREAERFVRETLESAGMRDVIVVSVSESGASVYSASPLAVEEFPDLDVTVRGAISIAHRLQDPLAELVKIDPKSIGVGQYQHDVSQTLLARKLDEVVESCVNRVGVELNTASGPLLSRVAGIGPALARSIVEHRQGKGAFERRRQLLDVPRLGPKAYEQAAGFLRIRGADNPLDDSAVHPERYRLVQGIARDLGVGLKDLVGSTEIISRIDICRYVDGEVGEPTLRDIVEELRKPGRDPREDFRPPEFREDVQTISDLEQGMQLEGVVTNVTAFGAFVDVGVHRDGLVHISELSDRFVRDASEVVKVGDRLRVRVIDVDMDRERISLSARSEGGGRKEPPARKRPEARPEVTKKPGTYNPFADALKKR